MDDEEDLGNLVNFWCNQLEHMKVDCAQKGEEAWKMSQGFHYDFIVLDWKIDGNLDGLALINRFRKHRFYCDIPILVISGFLSKKEFSIVDELPLTGILEKPLQEQPFFKAVSSLYQDCNWYKKQQATITKAIEKCINDEKALTQVIIKMLHKTNNPASMLTSIGRALLHLGVEDKAEMVFLKAVEQKPNSAYLNNELGKIHLKRGELDDACKYLEKALQFSPDNIDRLCNLGNIELQKMHLDKAATYFNKASSIDSEDKSVKGGKVLTANISEWLKEQDSIPASFASMLNSIGIGMARNGSFNKCIEHYQSALKHVYTPDLKAKVSFNLGLAYLRWRKAGKANNWFKAALNHDPTFEKANHWMEKLRQPKPVTMSQDPSHPIQESYSVEPFKEVDFESNDDFESFSSNSSFATDFVRQDADGRLSYGGNDSLDFLDEKIGQVTSEHDDYNISDKLFTYIDRKPIPSTCLAVSKDKLEIQTFTEIKVDSKVVLVVDDRGYEFDIISNTPAKTDDIYAFHMILHAVDRGIDLQQILAATPG